MQDQAPFRHMTRIHGNHHTHELYAYGPTGRVSLAHIDDKEEADLAVGFLNQVVSRIRDGESLDDILGKEGEK